MACLHVKCDNLLTVNTSEAMRRICQSFPKCLLKYIAVTNISIFCIQQIPLFFLLFLANINSTWNHYSGSKHDLEFSTLIFSSRQKLTSFKVWQKNLLSHLVCMPLNWPWRIKLKQSLIRTCTLNSRFLGPPAFTSTILPKLEMFCSRVMLPRDMQFKAWTTAIFYR